MIRSELVEIIVVVGLNDHVIIGVQLKLQGQKSVFVNIPISLVFPI